MSADPLQPGRVRVLLRRARQLRVLVVGDVMLDRFIWGQVSRISPEAPVPVVEFERESFMPGGAANVARNWVALGGQAELFGVVGPDAEGDQLRQLLRQQGIGCRGLLTCPDRFTSVKTRIVAQKQQVVRLDRESNGPLEARTARTLMQRLRQALARADAVIVADYGKGVVTDELLAQLKPLCRQRGLWLSLDPKPVHALDLTGLSLLTPNRREAFELAGLRDTVRAPQPLQDPPLLQVAQHLLQRLQPALLLITLGELGMLLCHRQQPPLHIPTVAREVFDVSGAGDTVIATFTLAIAAGASPAEAASLANHAAGIVVGKFGTATASPQELLASYTARGV
ncbi:D-glycero-beta-D-manno-heptose-7-phosphate kinase [Limisphaera sp. VF-2]|jgi:rfaE bifunctional protein kinase chain/domain|uniref:D-glycero-beta-D-manno-heptose-7-phosphate kinase n=1 Tax=Limisphaera sp. VF-2 TaxID=3400418 RepID=UPI00175BD3C0|nr:D-glycero-beta-D-manno-heptose-7-phosphate kinase [Limisphaera sp.]